MAKSNQGKITALYERLSRDDVVCKLGCHERLNVLGGAPPGRAILHAVAVLFCVFATQIDRQP